MTDLVSLTRSAKSIFFLAIIQFTIFSVTISEFGANLAKNDKAQEHSQPEGVVKRLVGSHVNKISQTA